MKDETLSQLYIDLSEFSSWKWDDNYKITLSMPANLEVDKAKLFYQFSEDDEEWTDAEEVGEDSTAPFEWSFKAEEGNGYYRFYAKVYESSGPILTSNAEKTSVTLMPIPALAIYIMISVVFILVTLFIIIQIRKND